MSLISKEFSFQLRCPASVTHEIMEKSERNNYLTLKTAANSVNVHDKGFNIVSSSANATARSSIYDSSRCSVNTNSRSRDNMNIRSSGNTNIRSSGNTSIRNSISNINTRSDSTGTSSIRRNSGVGLFQIPATRRGSISNQTDASPKQNHQLSEMEKLRIHLTKTHSTSSLIRYASGYRKSDHVIDKT